MFIRLKCNIINLKNINYITVDASYINFYFRDSKYLSIYSDNPTSVFDEIQDNMIVDNKFAHIKQLKEPKV